MMNMLEVHRPEYVKSHCTLLVLGFFFFLTAFCQWYRMKIRDLDDKWTGTLEIMAFGNLYKGFGQVLWGLEFKKSK